MKRNLKEIQAQMKKLETIIRELETDFHVEIGKTTLQWLRGEKNITELQSKISEIKAKFGKE